MLQEIREKHQTKIFKKYFCLFAFSTEQFKKQANENFVYSSLGGGLYAPSKFAMKVVDKLEQVHKDAVKECQSKNTLEEIIWYELGNYETQISGDLDEVRSVLKDFDGMTEELLISTYNKFYNYCCKHDMF